VVQRSEGAGRTNVLDEMVSSELFDHTWIASIRQLEKHLLLADGQTVLDAGCGWRDCSSA
jgi:cyclopropane fatty-acyl-phospholipid synthase-like methyltransferase